MADKNKNKDNLPPNFSSPKKGKPKFSFYWIYAVLAIIFIGIQIFNYSSPQKDITWNQLFEMLAKQDVEKIVVVNKEKAEVYIKKDRIAKDTALSRKISLLHLGIILSFHTT
jgi:cell division protease FtsH